MAKSKKPDHVTELDGYRVEWRRRRGHTDCDVIRDGETVAELEYPKVNATFTAGQVYDELAREAVHIAKRKEEEKREREIPANEHLGPFIMPEEALTETADAG